MSALATLKTLDPFAVYQEMRSTSPVYQDKVNQTWNVFSYENVQQVLSDYNTFSSQFAGDPDDPTQPFAASMITTDPPRHRQLRTLVTQAFTPRAIDALEPRIREIVDEYLDKVMDSGRMDMITDLGYPLPVIVIAEMMGIPSEDRDRFKGWSDMIVEMANTVGAMDYENMDSTAIMEMSAYFFNLLEERGKNPGSDLLSGLLQANIEGQHLEMIELLGFASLLLVAGNETTTNLLGNALLTFTEHPGTWETLRSNRDLLPGAIEEVLRYRSPVQSMYRVCKAETQLGDTTLPKDAYMVAWIGSANRDEAQFPQADRFDIRRSPNKHLAFGQGIHFCLGAPLARLEARIALGEMLERFAHIERADDAPLERIDSTLVYGVPHLPLRFERA